MLVKKILRESGTGLIEIILALSIVLLGVFALLKTYNYYLRFALSHRHDAKVALLLEEGIEAIKILRDVSWSQKIATLSSGSVYSLEFVNSTWSATTSRKYVDGVFDRTLVLSDVYRDSSDDIAGSGVLDSNTKKAVVLVAYNGIVGTTTKSVSVYVTNLFSN